MFILVDWVGYYLVGTYLLKAKIRRLIACIGVAVGFLGAFVGAWLITLTMGEVNSAFFTNYQSFSIIVGSTCSFSLLLSINQKSIEHYARTNRLINWVGSNTLPIYLLHPIILEILTEGILGFTLPVLGLKLLDIPILTLTVFALTALLVYAVKKIPYVSKLIG
jgi:surface polysaccharide O-acyltransferase-like enzyme